MKVRGERGEGEGRDGGGRGEEERRKRAGRGEGEGRKRGGRGEEDRRTRGGGGRRGVNTGVNRAQSLDKQGDTLIAHNSILQSTTLKYKNLTSCVKILVSGLSRISSSCSSDTSRLAGGRGGGGSIQCHTHNQHTIRMYVCTQYTLYI